LPQFAGLELKIGRWELIPWNFINR